MIAIGITRARDGLPNYIYTVFHPIPTLFNIELNHAASFFEEFSLASILWDFYDPLNTIDDDSVFMPIEDLWEVLMTNYTVPVYYSTLGNEIYDFLGDGYTYSTLPDLREIQDESGFTEYPMEERHIYYIRDLYDALVYASVGNPMLTIDSIDEIFGSHRQYMNSYYIYDDYSNPPLIDSNIVTVADTGSSVQFTQSSPPDRSWWANGITVSGENVGWGSGIMVEKEFESTGWLYAWVYVNAPAGTEMSVVVEDYAGQWISPFTSDGQGFTQPHVVLLGPKYTLPEQNGFVPNPYSLTPEASTGPRTYDEKVPFLKIGLLVHTPGSFEVDIGPIVLIRGYPWKSGMYQVMGIGDPGASPSRPYRRNKPAIEGASILMSIDEIPAILKIEEKYAPPYEDLSFTYYFNLTEMTSLVGLFVEPGVDGVDNEVIISVEKDGYISSDPISITSSSFIESLGVEEHIMEVDIELTPEPIPETGTKPVSETENKTEPEIEIESPSGGIPGFPLISIGFALLALTLLHRKEIISKRF